MLDQGCWLVCLKNRGEKALTYIKQFGVEVQLNTRVKDYDGKDVRLSSGEVIPAKTVIWAAGVTGNLFDGIPVDAVLGGRIQIDDYNRVKGVKDVFAIGDIAIMPSKEYPKGHPMVAPVAIQQASLLGKNLKKKSQLGSPSFTKTRAVWPLSEETKW